MQYNGLVGLSPELPMVLGDTMGKQEFIGDFTYTKDLFSSLDLRRKVLGRRSKRIINSSRRSHLFPTFIT